MCDIKFSDSHFLRTLSFQAMETDFPSEVYMHLRMEVPATE